ncbi:MAG TPA: sugar ABC transporter permease [Candidatus Limnocylindrales bacterium]
MDRLISSVLVVLAVPAVLVGYVLTIEAFAGRLPRSVGDRIRPWLWLLPAFAFVLVFLIYPMIATILRSLYGSAEGKFVGAENYVHFFTSSQTLAALGNNILWLVFLTGLTVGIGLIVAVLVDRVRYESVVKTVIFLPMAISFVAAGVIWRFMYELNPSVGTLNAVVVALGGQPVPWLINAPLNTFMLIVVGVWMQAGFAMVILSAGLKGISTELLEAARVDGANERQVFRSIMLPLLMPTIAVITTTIVIIALKTFDIVYTMTNGNFDTEVIANRMYKELFNYGQPGQASATAVILLVAVVPVMLFNIRRFQQQEAIR